MKERRQFYRIDDKVSLNYRIIRNRDIEQEIIDDQRGRDELAELRNALFCIDTRLEDISYQLSNEQPLVAEMIKLLNNKFALQQKIMGVHEPDEAEEIDKPGIAPAREVNLSASGVAFETGEPLKAGTHLRLEIVTYPERHYIPAYARVITCVREGEDKQERYKIAVKFKAISDNNQEKIIQHIFSRQADEIKHNRERRNKAGEMQKDSMIVKLIK